MKNKFHQMLLILVVFVLAACQATPAAPTERPAVDFFKDQPGRWISVRIPEGWVAKQGVSSTSPSVVLTNDEAISILILPLTDKGSAEQVLQIALGRFNKMLTLQMGDIALEKIAGQSYASVEYQGKSAEQDNVLAYYLYTVISTDQRSVLVLTNVTVSQEKTIKPAYQSVVKGVTVH